jgi:hypothetical protein
MITYFFLSVLTLVWAVMFLAPLVAYMALGVDVLRRAMSSTTMRGRHGPQLHVVKPAAYAG